MTMNHSENDLLALFETGHEALKAERLLKDAHVPLRLVPAPPGLSTGCALALRFPAAKRRSVAAVLDDGNVQVKQLFRYEGGSWLPADPAA